jgi:hypothetical protein
LLALFILKATREARRRNMLWIGLTTLLITATRLQFLVLGGAVFALFVLIDWLALRREWARGAWRRLIAGTAIGLVPLSRSFYPRPNCLHRLLRPMN